MAHAQAHSGERSRYPHEGRKHFKGTEPWSEDVALESSVALWLRLSVSFLCEAGRGGMEDPDRILDQSKSLISIAKRFDHVPPHNSEVAEARDQHARPTVLCGSICIKIL